MGSGNPATPIPPGYNDMAYLMYTSGTTGPPKGACLPHRCFTSIGSTAENFIPHLSKDFVFLSYMPLAHSFAAILEGVLIMYGSTISFYHGNIKYLGEDLTEVRPHLLGIVPRVMKRMMSKILDAVNTTRYFPVRFMINRAYHSQANRIRNGIPLDQATHDKIFSKVTQKVGLDRLDTLITGAAPCTPALLEFFRVILGPKCAALQGYGMTEACAGDFCQDPRDFTYNVGSCLNHLECKLVDVKEMGYTTKVTANNPHPTGEIWYRGPSVFDGYFENAEETRKVLTSDGWLMSGDIARFNPNGTVSIIDRKKNLFKTAQGEYIASEKVESDYLELDIIWQFWLYGNSEKSFVIGMIVPNALSVVEYAKSNGWWNSQAPPATQKWIEDYAKMFKPHYDQIKEWIKPQLAPGEKKLTGLEKIRDFELVYEIDDKLNGFTEAKNLMTPTMKLRRQNLFLEYLPVLKKIYEKNGEPTPAGQKWPGEK